MDEGGRGMKEFIGRFSSAVSVRGRSDYVLMVMRVRQRESDGKREGRGRGTWSGRRRRAHHLCQ